MGSVPAARGAGQGQGCWRRYRFAGGQARDTGCREPGGSNPDRANGWAKSGTGGAPKKEGRIKLRLQPYWPKSI